MPIARTVKQYLDNKHVIYSVLEAPCFESPFHAAQLANIPPQALFYPVVLRDAFGLMMAVLPASRKLDYQRLSAMLNRNVEPAFQTQLSSVFSDCQAGLIPPLGDAYNIRTIIDSNVPTPDEIYILAGDHSRLIKISRKDFLLMQTNAWLGSDFTREIDVEQAVMSSSMLATDKHRSLRERIEQITEMPAMPDMAGKLIELRADPDAGVTDLVSVLEKDPSLAAQVMRYANSPFFGYRGEVNTLQVAIARVLGFDMVMNLALGLALMESFKIPKHGPLSLNRCWEHSVYSASLMQMLCQAMPQGKRPRAATCYLIGLLHDFGYFVLGHLFRDEYINLSEQLVVRSDEERVVVERDCLGIDHGQVGFWLLKAWHLPDEVVASTREHHTEQYQGPFSVYVHLARLTDHLLRAYEAGEVHMADLPADELRELGLSHSQVLEVMDQLIEQDNNLREMVRRLVA